eukprot:684668_1
MALSILMSAISLSLVVFAIYVLFKFISAIREEKLSKFGKTCSVIFLISTPIALLFWGLISTSRCTGLPHEFLFFPAIFIVLYVTQSITLLLIFFNRILNVFRPTKFGLSHCTTNVYIALFVFELISGALMGIAYILEMGTIALVLIALFFVTLVILIISLVILFIYKLMQVYKCMEEESSTMLATVITKTTILFSISVVATFMDYITIFLRTETPNNRVLNWIQEYITICDLCTNFLCTIMSFKSFKMYYSKICACLDSKCRSCWAEVVNRTNVDVMLAETVANAPNKPAPPSTQTNTTTTVCSMT